MQLISIPLPCAKHSRFFERARVVMIFSGLWCMVYLNRPNLDTSRSSEGHRLYSPILKLQCRGGWTRSRDYYEFNFKKINKNEFN